MNPSLAPSLIRSFNRQGIEEFRVIIQRFADGDIGYIPSELLSDPKFSTVVAGRVEVEPQSFELKIDAARYLTPRIEQLQIPNKYYATGLWAWLSAFYFDSLCPPDANATRKPGAQYLYLLGDIGGHGNLHRHLLATPIRIYRTHGDIPKLILYESIHRNNEFINELTFRQELAMNSGVLEAANLLYWDDIQQKPKAGASNRTWTGSLRRFISVISQLDLTYDLQSMSGEQIVRLLPEHEFAAWWR